MGKTIKVGSDFSGVGAFNQALIRLGIKYDEIFACDMDKYARQTFELNYGPINYFPKDVYEREIPKESLDIYMTSPPCQAFSLAGKRMGKEDKRGILFFNSHEFIKENKPRYFIFENVKGLLSHDKVDKSAAYGRTFQEWINYLGGKSVNGVHNFFPIEDSAPYHIYFQVLNAKHYGIPQNRERIFIIGIRDDEDNDFQFPKPFPLKKRLKDVLESEVDEKYFLSDKMLGYLNTRKDNFNNGNINYKDENSVASTLTKSSSSIDISDNILKVGFVNQDTQASQVFSENGTSPSICAGTHGYALGYIETEIGTWRTHEDGKGFRATEDNNCPTIPARAREDGSGQPVVKINANFGNKRLKETLNSKEVPEEDCIIDSYNKTFHTEVSPCISTRTNASSCTHVKVSKEVRTDESKSTRKQTGTNAFRGKEIEFREQDFMNTITTSLTNDHFIIPANNSKGFDEAEEEDSINFSNPNSETRRGRVGKKVSQTLDTQCNQGIATKQLSKQRLEKLHNLEVDENIAGCITEAIGRTGSSDEYISSVKRNAIITQRIRRLTPTEAFRLMDFNQDMIERTINAKKYFYFQFVYNIFAINQQEILCDAKLKVVKEQQTQENLETYVLCTTKEFQKMELLTTLKQKSELKIENKENLKNVSFAIVPLVELEQKECVINITKWIDCTETPYIEIIKKTNQVVVDISDTITEKDCIEPLWKITLEENLSEERLFITLILLKQIMKSKIYTYVQEHLNTPRYINSIVNYEKKSGKLQLSYLRMESTKQLISDSMLYKQAGNSICVGVLAAIIEKLKI